MVGQVVSRARSGPERPVYKVVDQIERHIALGDLVAKTWSLQPTNETAERLHKA